MPSSSSTADSISLVAEDLSFCSEGVQGFWWPVSQASLDEFSRTIVASFAALSREAVEADADGADAFIATSLFILNDVLSLYQGHLLMAAVKAEGRSVVVQPSLRLWSALQREEMPNSPPFLKVLSESFPSRSLGDVLMKPLRLLLPMFKSKEGTGCGAEKSLFWKSQKLEKVIHGGLLTPRVLAKGVVATKRDLCLNRHAQQEHREVTYSRHKSWFNPISARQLARKNGTTLDPQFRKKVLETLDSVFAAGKAPLTDVLRKYLKELIDSSTALAGVHLNRLANKRLPMRLWTGTGGNIWDRMLRLAVKRAGGHVTGHDHSFGRQFLCASEYMFVEYTACNQYVTFSAAQAEMARKSLDSSLLFELTFPEIISLEKDATKVPCKQPIKKSSGKLRVMYLSKPFWAERVTVISGRPGDPVMLDWQARLVSQLSKWGYQVLFKPHPESQITTPEGIEHLGAKIVEGLVENYLDEVDLFILDSARTTAFSALVQSGIPMVLVDFGFDEWHGEALELVQGRVNFVPAVLDDHNRVAVEWDALQNGIETALKLPGTPRFEKFSSRYYS